MMFPYFGSKQRVLNLYPRPLYNMIIEPFCGSARYACKYGIDRDVWINDLNPTIYGIWKWIQQASKADVRALPVLKKGEDLRDYKQLSQPERDLLGFCIHIGDTKPRNICSSFAAGIRGRRTKATRHSRDKHVTERTKGHLIRLAGKIGHWQITNCNYEQVAGIRGSWFVDPPYQTVDSKYPVNDVNYSMLATYCQALCGQIIVCEASAANWLPFKMLHEVANSRKERSKTRRKVYQELIWYRSDRKRGFGLV